MILKNWKLQSYLQNDPKQIGICKVICRMILNKLEFPNLAVKS